MPAVYRDRHGGRGGKLFGSGMKIVYLILAHNCPAHLQRLVRALSSPAAACLIHVDAKADMAQFRGIAGPAVGFTRGREAVHWGAFSQVAAIRALIREALASPARYDRFVLLSGVDYPLYPPACLDAFFERNPQSQFIEMASMPCAATSKSLSRLSNYQPDPPRTALGALLGRVRRRLGIPPRQRDYLQALAGLQPYAGATWWALTRDACEYIEAFAEEHPDLVDFFRNTVCPDEMFIHTILGNSRFGADVQPDLTYADWSAKGPSPAYLTLEHVEMLRHARFSSEGREMLFARKLSDDRAHVTAALDALLGEERQDEWPGRSTGAAQTPAVGCSLVFGPQDALCHPALGGH